MAVSINIASGLMVPPMGPHKHVLQFKGRGPCAIQPIGKHLQWSCLFCNYDPCIDPMGFILLMTGRISLDA